MAAAVETRKALLPLYPTNENDLGRQSPSLGKLSQGPKHIRKSLSIGALKSVSATKAESIKQSPGVENFVSRIFPEPIAEDLKPSIEVSSSQRRSMEEDQREKESTSLLQLKMEAMTWAAMAKDYTISSLEKRLRQALEIAKAEQERNQELGRLLRESKEREAVAEIKLEDAKMEIRQLIDAEERLCVQLGDLEVEAVEEDRRYRSQIATLTARIEAQDQFIAEALKPLKAGQLTGQQLDSLSYVQNSQYQSLAEKLEMAETEITALQAELSNAMTEMRIAESLKKSQSRRLKTLQKERRYLMRRGVIRSLRVVPSPKKVLSIMDTTALETL